MGRNVHYLKKGAFFKYKFMEVEEFAFGDAMSHSKEDVMHTEIFTEDYEEERLSYVINLQETNLEYEDDEELYLNKKVNEIIEDKKQERKKYEELGKLIPITTPNEPIIIKIAESRSQAFAIPLRPKKAETEIMFDATYRAGRVTLQQINARPIPPPSGRFSLSNDPPPPSYEMGGRNSIRTSTSTRSSMIQGHNEVKSRVSKTVDFGVAQQHQVENETAEWDDILLDHPCCNSCSIT